MARLYHGHANSNSEMWLGFLLKEKSAGFNFVHLRSFLEPEQQGYLDGQDVHHGARQLQARSFKNSSSRQQGVLMGGQDVRHMALNDYKFIYSKP